LKGRGSGKQMNSLQPEYTFKTGRNVEVFKKVVLELMSSVLGVTLILLERFKER